jgi:hypothetical protein
MWVGGQRYDQTILTAEEDSRYQLYRRLAGPQGQYGRVRKSHLHRDSIPGLSSRYTN